MTNISRHKSLNRGLGRKGNLPFVARVIDTSLPPCFRTCLPPCFRQSFPYVCTLSVHSMLSKARQADANIRNSIALGPFDGPSIVRIIF